MAGVEYKVGNGVRFKLWRDPWHLDDPLIRNYPRGPAVTGLPEDKNNVEYQTWTLFPRRSTLPLPFPPPKWLHRKTPPAPPSETPLHHPPSSTSPSTRTAAALRRTSDGFIIFSTDPFVQTIRKDFSKDGRGLGIGVVEMIFGANVFAVVGGGIAPALSRKKIMILDDHLGQFTGEISFRSEVKSVRLRRDRIVAVTMQKVSVYDLPGFRSLHQIETQPNPKGLCEISRSGPMVLACLGLNKGQVRLEHYEVSRSRLITAHDSAVVCLALTSDGRLLATASSKGTLIRVFNTLDGVLLQELRRGSERAEIHSLSFSSAAEWLAASSDKGTVHVFSVNTDSGPTGTNQWQDAGRNNTSPSRLSFVKGMLPKYFSSEWSRAQFRVPEDIQHIVAFGHRRNTVLIIGFDGTFYRCKFDPMAGGEMTQMECRNFLEPELNS
ncbi:Autophagy-related protein 18a [Sesamum alatum]|uniref:Autophagy-related protein 18a n=1 Tax=Sesamum alatum TaxID=300844 RepID=A0AAE2CJW4_9LAMI|nr:Autophagy-related protein 18a [Sesamum alatum]